MYGCESCTIKKAECRLWCWRRPLRESLGLREIQPVHPKGDQSWMFTGRTDVEAETLNTLATWCEELTHLKRPWCWERLRAGGVGTIEDEMVGWHHWHSAHGFGWTLGVGDGQGGLACCGSWGHKELDMTERLNWTEPNGFSSSHVWMWELGHKEVWVPKN